MRSIALAVLDRLRFPNNRITLFRNCGVNRTSTSEEFPLLSTNESMAIESVLMPFEKRIIEMVGKAEE